MESITVTDTPDSTSVTVEALKAHLRLNTDDEDALLEDWLIAADDLFARMTGFVLVPTGLRLNLDGWPGGTIYLPRHPVTGVTAVEYLDAAGDWVAVDPADYSTDLDAVPARVVFASGFAFPKLHAVAVPRVRVDFDAGTGDAPKLALQAVKLLAAHWYKAREAYGGADMPEVPQGFRAVCNQFRTGIQGRWNQ